MLKVLKIIGNILSYILLGCEAIFLIITLVSRISGDIPSFFGYSFYTVASPSMTPELQVGDVILSKEFKDDTILVAEDVLHFEETGEHTGTVITYQGLEGNMAGKVITHRVVDLLDDGRVVTRGDANSSNDPIIEKNQIYSVMVCKCFVIGFMYKILSSTAGFIILLVVPLGYLIISEVINIAKAKVEAESEENSK